MYFWFSLIKEWILREIWTFYKDFWNWNNFSKSLFWILCDTLGYFCYNIIEMVSKLLEYLVLKNYSKEVLYILCIEFTTIYFFNEEVYSDKLPFLQIFRKTTKNMFLHVLLLWEYEKKFSVFRFYQLTHIGIPRESFSFTLGKF